jgi:predicted PurR-regulated permease PerM
MSLPAPTERQARVIWLALTGLAIAALVALVVAFVWGMGKVIHLLAPVLWPLAVAAIAACLLDPAVGWFERRRTPRPRAILYVFALALVLVTTVLSSVVPQVVSETRQLVAQVPGYAGQAQARVKRWMSHPPALVRKLLHRPPPPEPPKPPPPAPAEVAAVPDTNAPAAGSVNPNDGALFPSDLDPDTIKSATGWVARALPQVGGWLFGQMGRLASWFGVLAGLALVPVYTFYFLLEKRGILARWSDYLPIADSSFKNELVFVLNSINGYLVAFFRGQLLVAMCDGCLYGLGFLIVGLPYAVLIGGMAICLTMIPFLGAIITCATAFMIAVVHFGDWLHPLLVLAVFGCVQALDSLAISPRIMGGRVGLHPLTIIIAVITGTTLLGGLLGGILAIPLTAVLRVILSRYVWRRTEGQGKV